MTLRKIGPLFVAMILVFGVACGEDDPENQTQNQVDNDDNGDDEGPELTDPSADSQDLLDAISDYEGWDHYAGNDSQMESGHPGDIWVVSHANEGGQTAAEETPAEEGSIIVKEEYTEEGADDPPFVTVIEKLSDEEGDWYWLKATADLDQVVVHPDAGPLEGTENLGCIDCHGQASDNDYLVLPTMD